VKARLKAMKGKPFDPAASVQIAGGLLKQSPEEVYGLRFTVERAGDDTGIVVSFDLLSGARAALLDDQFTNRCAAAIGLGKTGRLRQAGKPPGSRGQGCPSCQTPLRRRLSWTSKHKIDCRLSTEPTPRRKPWSFAVG